MTIIGIVGGAQAYSSTSGGKVYAYDVLTTLVQVAPVNPSRRKLTFHNPGPVDILVGPVISVGGTTYVPSTVNYGGTFRIFANGGTLVIDGECQGAWQALSIDGTRGLFTVMDSNL